MKPSAPAEGNANVDSFILSSIISVRIRSQRLVLVWTSLLRLNHFWAAINRRFQRVCCDARAPASASATMEMAIPNRGMHL